MKLDLDRQAGVQVSGKAVVNRLNLGERDFRRISVSEECGVCQQEVDVFPEPYKGGTGDHQVERQGSSDLGSKGQDADRDAADFSGSNAEVFGEVACDVGRAVRFQVLLHKND